MYTFSFDHCHVFAAYNVFCNGWGVIATKLDANGKKDHSVKAIYSIHNAIKDENLRNECPDFNKTDYKTFYTTLRNTIAEVLSSKPIWYGHSADGSLQETCQDITVLCYAALQERNEDSRNNLDTIRGWAKEFDDWWWSLSFEEREERDYMLAVEDFSEKKLADASHSPQRTRADKQPPITAPNTFRSHNAINLIGKVTDVQYINRAGVDVCLATVQTSTRFLRLNGSPLVQNSWLPVHLWQNHLDIPVHKIQPGNILRVEGEFKNTKVHTWDGDKKLVGVFAAKAEVLSKDGTLVYEESPVEYGKPYRLE